MKLTTGLFSCAVFQRGADNCSHQKFSGMVTPGGQVTVEVVGQGEKCCCQADGAGRFTGTLEGVPVGGPYKILLRADGESLEVTDAYVGDVWMLAGQSNMEGYGNLDNAAEPEEAIQMYAMDDAWRNAADPLHDLDIANAEIHWTLRGGREAASLMAKQKCGKVKTKGAGLGLYFASEMKKRTGVPQGLIASAHGGTSMFQWDPALKSDGNNSLYGAMMNRYRRTGASGLAGLLWYQGCNETNNDEDVRLFCQRTEALFNAFRQDIGCPHLPVVQVQLAGFSSLPNAIADNRWSNIREAQRQMPMTCRRLLTVPAIGSEMDDQIHLSGKAHRRLASQMAEAMEWLATDGVKGAAPIELEKVEWNRAEYNLMKVILTFRNVQGQLTSDWATPSGFSLHLPGKDNAVSYPPLRVDLRGNQAILLYGSPLAAKVSYGFGQTLPVNIHDAGGRGLPAFGPLFIHDFPRMTSLLTQVECSEPLMGACDFEALLPSSEKLRGMTFSTCPADGMYVMPPRLVRQGPYCSFLRWRLHCSRPCKCLAMLGIDGDFRLCCDGKEIYGRKDVPNPIVLDQYQFPLELTAGDHEMTMGLDGKLGMCWGFALRLAAPEEILTIDNEDQVSENLPEWRAIPDA